MYRHSSLRMPAGLRVDMNLEDRNQKTKTRGQKACSTIKLKFGGAVYSQKDFPKSTTTNNFNADIKCNVKSTLLNFLYKANNDIKSMVLSIQRVSDSGPALYCKDNPLEAFRGVAKQLSLQYSCPASVSDVQGTTCIRVKLHTIVQSSTLSAQCAHDTALLP